MQTNRGTHGYRAPETYLESNEGYEGDKADIFSLGVILFILAFGVPPFCEATKDDTFYRYFCRGPNSLKFFFRLHPSTKKLFASGSLDTDLLDLLQSLLEEDPTKRIQPVSKIREHPYLNKELVPRDETSKLIEQMMIRPTPF